MYDALVIFVLAVSNTIVDGKKLVRHALIALIASAGVLSLISVFQAIGFGPSMLLNKVLGTNLLVTQLTNSNEPPGYHDLPKLYLCPQPDGLSHVSRLPELEGMKVSPDSGTNLYSIRVSKFVFQPCL